MRKLVFLLVFILNGFILAEGHGATCVRKTSGCSGANEYLTIPGMPGCYECGEGNDECPNGTVISATSATLEGNLLTNNMFTCHVESWGDLWRPTPVQECTQRRYLVLKNDNNAHQVMINPNSSAVISGGGDSAIAVVGVQACIGYVCDAGFIESDGRCAQLNPNCRLNNGTNVVLGHVINNNRCNPPNQSTGLADTAHVRTGNVCKVTCVEGGWNVELQDNACEAGWVVDASKKKCVEDPAAVQRRERDRLANATKQEKCQATGGTWANNKCTCPADKNLKKDGDECICLDDNYRRSDDGKSCVLTDEASLRRQCEAAASTGAYYQDGRCLCQDRDKIWRGNGCVENTDIARCRTATRTKWDYNAQECVCLDANYEYDSGNNECVETEEGRTRREAEEKKQRQEAEQAAAKGRITSIMGNLSSLQSGLSKSVWKNKEGNFNTSRLVSDSVAGVVLGTAGGLITSNVIKKNQVKGGFEDIQCTVRGQVVAGYGDEFQVGIQ